MPEKREEITTEGGLDVLGNRDRVQACAARLADGGIDVSLFIDPDERQIDAACELGVSAVELHTGRYADAEDPQLLEREFLTLVKAGAHAVRQGLILHMGHGLTYRNVSRIADIPDLCELNIGHSIVSRAVMVGFTQAVREMKSLVVR